jgi:predicted phage terminase large subunit-like protein
VRWFVVADDVLRWYESREAAANAQPHSQPKSFTYIRSTIWDNQILLATNPEYLANLRALDHIENERLEKGNHLIRAEAGKVFDKTWFEVVDALPAEFDGLVRFWDLAASERKQKKADPDYTAGVLLGVHRGVFYVIDVIAEQLGPAAIDKLLYHTATQDGRHVPVRWEEEGGASGKRDSYALATMLAGWDATGIRPQGDKLTRSRALAAQAKIGNVKVLRRSWTDTFLNHMHNIPDGAHDDIHDAAAGAFNELALPHVEGLVVQNEEVSISVY